VPPLLVFPPSPNNGDLYPITPAINQNQYQWSSADITWILLGSGTGVTVGTYGSSYNIPRFTVDAVGRISFAQDIPLPTASTTQPGIVQLVDDTVTNDPTKALTAAQGYHLQEQIGDTALLNPPFPDLVTAINAVGGTTGVNVGTYGDSLTVGQFTVNSLGKLTFAQDVPIASASTTQVGVVQLNDTFTSTSTTEAATANALKTTYDIAVAAIPCASFTAKGDLLVGSGSGTYTALPVAPDRRFLVTDSTAAEGVKWGTLGFQDIDDISSSFDGVQTSFPLAIGGTAYSPSPVSNLMVFLGGVAQSPGISKSYTVSGSTITFSSPPLVGTEFYAVTVA
jgi:hypothetical protein